MGNTAIVCHGYNLHSPDWEKIVWGISEKMKKGRVVKAIEEFVKYKADFLIFGTGSSVKDGLIEAEYIKKYMFDNLLSVDDFFSIKSSVRNFVIDYFSYKKAKKFFAEKIILETKSKNTFEEIKNCLQICKQKNIENVIFVSNPSHCPRIMRDANNINTKNNYNLNIYVTACDTDFAKDEEVVIFEPHSGPNKRPDLTPAQVFKKYFSLSAEDRLKVLKKIDKIFNFNLQGSE